MVLTDLNPQHIEAKLMLSLMADCIPASGTTLTTDRSLPDSATVTVEIQQEVFQGFGNLFMHLMVLHEKGPLCTPITIFRVMAKTLTYLACLTALMMFLCLVED
jgi:hypothetical protein